MTHDFEPHDFENVLRRFQPIGPPAELRARILALQRPAARIAGAGRPPALVVGLMAATAFAAVTIWIAYRPAVATRPAAPVSRSAASFSPLTLDERIAFAEAWPKEPRVDLGFAADGASVLLVEFVDWLCPPCEDAHNANLVVANEYARRMPGRLKYVVADWPWNAECNAGVTTTLHPGACAAAAFVRMARTRGKADAMVDWLFAHQAMIASRGPRESVLAIKAGAAEILGSIDLDREYAERLVDLRRDTAPGRGVRLNGTPTTFVNGVRLPAGVKPAYVDFAIQIELGNAGVNLPSAPSGGGASGSGERQLR